MDQLPVGNLFEEEFRCGFDDLVPGECESGIFGGGSPAGIEHDMECRAQRALLRMPHVRFSSLQVHRCDDGICLTGVVHVAQQDARPHFEQVAGIAAGVDLVLNRLVVRRG